MPVLLILPAFMAVIPRTSMSWVRECVRVTQGTELWRRLRDPWKWGERVKSEGIKSEGMFCFYKEYFDIWL